MLSNLNLPLRTLPGIGLKREKVLENAGIATVGDLLLYLPYRYIDRSTEVGIAHLPLDGEVTAVGEIVSMQTIPGKRRRFVMTVEDQTGSVACTWFGGIQYLKNAYRAGDIVALGGKLTRFGRTLQMVHPEIEVLANEDDDNQRLHTGRIIPLYSTTSKMKSDRLTARALRRLLFAALQAIGDQIEDPLDENIRKRCGLMRLRDAIEKIHFPDTKTDIDTARQRLSFDEIFYIQLYLGKAKKLRQRTPGRVLASSGLLTQQLVANLPFKLTHAQTRAIAEIGRDLQRPVAMHRLLQGDVGSGKTLVALHAMLCAADSGAQAALMAPTEILAEQHAHTIRELVAPLGLDIALMTGRMRKAQRATILDGLESGKIKLTVGTHALLQNDIAFADLALIVVDEQHRFGVVQRAMLREKGNTSHLLVMTATPIPRSLSLTLYGDLDVTIIDALPPGRIPVRTGWRFAQDRARALQFLRSELQQKRQAYIVYPLVSESEKSDLQAATAAFEDLQQGALSNFRLGLLHGRLKRDEKETTMSAFRRGDMDALVTTTVIEVGVDIPNATIMMVEHAERFGLSQLHQLRGRVGRGQHQSYCILIADPQDALSGEAHERLDAMARTTDGFEISEADLCIRGPGHIFGTQQAGFPKFHFADLARDGALITAARREAETLLSHDPNLTAHAVLRRELDATALHDMQIVEAG